MRTKEEIKKKIEEIKKERKTIPEYSAFGDPNWKTMDLQIAILEQAFSGEMNATCIGIKLENLVDAFDGEFPKEPVPKAKMDVYDWLLGNTDEL